jgi:flagellar motor switch protein FliN/FliY
MNAIPPKGQMPQPENPGHPQGDPIHLTMSFEEDMPAESDFADADHPAQAESPGARSAADQTRRSRAGAGQAQPDPADATGLPGATKPVRGTLPPQFAGIELALTVEVGGLNIALKDLMSVEPGQLLALDRMTSEPVSVLVNGKPFARGEIVAIGDRYGVRLLEIVSAAEIGG